MTSTPTLRHRAATGDHRWWWEWPDGRRSLDYPDEGAARWALDHGYAEPLDDETREAATAQGQQARHPNADHGEDYTGPPPPDAARARETVGLPIRRAERNDAHCYALASAVRRARLVMPDPLPREWTQAEWSRVRTAMIHVVEAADEWEQTR